MMKKSVIIIDDEKSILEVIEQKLSKYDVSVVKSCNGEDALNKLEKQKYDLIITDLKMPVLNGVSFVEKLRNSLINRLTPVIVLSATLNAEKVKKLALNNTAGILTKPIDEDRFYELIDEYLTNS